MYDDRYFEMFSSQGSAREIRAIYEKFKAGIRGAHFLPDPPLILGHVVNITFPRLEKSVTLCRSQGGSYELDNIFKKSID